MLQISDFNKVCLNPCCSGQWSRTDILIFPTLEEMKVLILVVVDNGLVQKKDALKNAVKDVLILVVVDNGLVL